MNSINLPLLLVSSSALTLVGESDPEATTAVATSLMVASRREMASWSAELMAAEIGVLTAMRRA